MDPTLASSAAAERVKTCIHIGLLCTQGDPQSRPDMRRIVVLLSKKAVSLEEPTRPGISGSRYRSRRPAEMSSSVGTSDTARTFGESDSRTFDSSSNSNTATGSTSAQITPRSFDPRGKRPIES